MTDLSHETSPSHTGESPHTVVVQQPCSQWVLWLIGVSLAVIALCMVLRTGATTQFSPSPAYAQSVGAAGAHGVFAFTGQLTKDSYGVFMVDIDTGVIWCYKYLSSKNVLQLVAARDWRYDRYLEDFATEPATEVVREQVEAQRAEKMRVGSP